MSAARARDAPKLRPNGPKERASGHFHAQGAPFFCQGGMTLSTFRALEQGRVLVGAESA